MIGAKAVRGGIWKILPLDLDAKRELRRERHVGGNRSGDEQHVKETAAWLARAHDAGGDGGVSRGYSAARISQVQYSGWEPSYPETTGYIVPTFLLLAQHFGEDDFARRALRMCNWEIAIQLESGAVMGSVITAPKKPAIFNTGQVIFGWLAMHERTGDENYFRAACRAGDYLLSVQDTDGSWSKGNSAYALTTATTYNARVAWSLIVLGERTGNSRYMEGGRRNIEYTLTKQQANGWFADNCLSDPNSPLLHTIVYAIRGVMESGIALGETRYVDAAAKALDALVQAQRLDGGIPGRLTADWCAGADWDCLTGDAQAAGAWLRLHSIGGGSKYRDAARKAIEFVKQSQNLEHQNPGIRGGVKGSFPFDGPYGRFEMLNWAAKFFVDALLMINDEKLALSGIRG